MHGDTSPITSPRAPRFFVGIDILMLVQFCRDNCRTPPFGREQKRPQLEAGGILCQFELPS
jgi:hypothetical protein